ncbi:MAG: beta-hexosaminidase [Clostridia bacterium]|nr:beta-hexosaminidase [Clostridia bacterium]
MYYIKSPLKALIFSILTISVIFFCSCAKEYDHDTEEQTTSDVSDTEIEIADTSDPADTDVLSPENEIDIRADELLSSMTLEEKVGQLFLCRNPLLLSDGLRLIEEKHVGGIIFFGRDFRNSNPEKFKDLIKSYNEKSKTPLLTAVDEEGGTVCRASLYDAFRHEKFSSPAELYEAGGIDAILADAKEKSEFLLDLGLNFNLAPVADLSQDEQDFIYKRSLGKGTSETSDFVRETVRVMNESGILSALKHFPGYGGNADTHIGIVYDTRSIETLRQNDFLPFIAGIEAGAPVILVSHNIIECIDSSLPASLSPKVIDILRTELKFDGVIMTDDLSMGAIESFTESGNAAVLAILAGNDLLCCSDIENQYDAVLEAVKDGRISEDRLNESVLRILKMKLKYNIC